MATCTQSESIYSDLPYCPGTKNLPGTGEEVYGISKRDVVSYPKIEGAPKDLKSAATYVGSFVLAADKKWHKIGMAVDQGQIQIENQGEEGSKTFKNTATIAIPGTEEEATGYINQANNDKMIYLVPQRNGKYRVIGSKEFTPKLTLNQDTGKAVTDQNVTTISAVADDKYAAPFYVGDIVTEDGTISAETGEAKADVKQNAGA